MTLNATLLGQMVTFAIFVWFTMKFVWPSLETMLDERKTKIAEGLAAAEKGQESLAKVNSDINVKLKEVQKECHDLIANARKQSEQILEEARVAGNDMLVAAKKRSQEQVNVEVEKAKVKLQETVANLVVLGAEKVIAKSISKDDHSNVLDSIANEMTG